MMADNQPTPKYGETRTATVQIDQNGRLVIPQPARDTLNIDGTNATVEINVTPLKDD